MQRCSLRLATMTTRRSLNPYTTSSSRNSSLLLSNLKKQPKYSPPASNNVRFLSTTAAASMEDNNDVKSAFLKPWPSPLVISKGDYRAEAFLENHIGGPLYKNQTDLPRLPIPTVAETLERLLPTALPLAKTNQERDAFLQACNEFDNQSINLQERLQHRKEVEMSDSSWLQLWWNTTGYLQVRDPVVVNVSYFFHFSDDGTLPDNKPWNVSRGASMLFAAAEYRKRVCSGTMPCEFIGKKKQTPLCSVAFKYMFHACRIPQLEEDAVKLYDPSVYSHAVVARKGRFYKVPLVDPTTADPLPLSTLEDLLKQVLEMADTPTSSSLGWLTSSNRDDWATARTELLRVGGIEMEQALEVLESGALLLCLDDEDPISRKQCGELFWHGGLKSGKNRWFDKSLQLFCTNNGKAGLQGEHSMMDGMPVVGLANHITATTYNEAVERSNQMSSGNARPTQQDEVKDIFGNVSNVLQEDAVVNQVVDKARNDFTKLVTDHDLDVQSFQGYGSNFIKRAGYSPDAYVQMAMQVATYRLFGEQVGTYEATQMRPFLHGRTETTRSVSTASHAFCEVMGIRPKHDEFIDKERKTKLQLLQQAVDAHVQYIGRAAKGQGVDRHFLGLQMEVQDNETAPTLYNDALFQRAKRWRVSTSHLTHPKFENWGYGEVVPDGVGLAYAIKADCCVFNITALAQHEWTDRLSHLLEEALLEMRQLIEVDKPPQSKL